MLCTVKVVRAECFEKQCRTVDGKLYRKSKTFATPNIFSKPYHNHYSTKVLNPTYSKTKTEYTELNIHFNLTVKSHKFSHVSHIRKAISRSHGVYVVKNHCSKGC